MAAHLPGTGVVCTYNGFTFDPAWTETRSFKAKAVQDEAKRTITHVVYTLTLRTVIADVNGTDAALDNARVRLMHQGADLTFQDKGFGTVSVNTAGTRRKDLKWGPVPQTLEMGHIGDNKAQEIIWTVEWCTMDCATAAYELGVLEFNYSVSYSVDHHRNSTRYVHGHIIIPQTRANPEARRIVRTADWWRERIAPALIPGFRRRDERYDVSDDKCKLSFHCTDTEMGPAPPPGVLEVRAARSWQTMTPLNLIEYGGTLRAEYTLERTADPRIAFEHFMRLLGAWVLAAKDSLKAAGFVGFKDDRDDKNIVARIGPPIAKGIGMAAGGIVGGLPGAALGALFFGNRAPDRKPNEPLFLPMSFSASEPDIYATNPQAHFNVGLKLVAGRNVFLTAGLWSPVPDSDWTRWSRSLPFGPRGRAGLAFNPNDDAIIDVCKNEQAGLKDKPGAAIAISLVPGGPVMGVVTPENSWIKYENSLTRVTTPGTASLTPLPEKPPAFVRGSGGSPDFDDAPYLTPLARSRTVVPEKTITVSRAADTVFIRMRGQAVRAGWKSYPPALDSVGGVPATLVDAVVEEKQIGAAGVPVYACRWDLLYSLPEAPQAMDSPAHPVFGGPPTNQGIG